MLRAQSFKALSTLLIASLALTVACKSKPKVEENLGGAEGQQLDSSVTSQPMSFDAQGSDSGKIDGLRTVHFDFDSSTIGVDARKELADNANWIKNNPKVTVQIEGHCDKQGSVEYNLSLGERRAKAVKNYLTGLGVDSKRLTIISYGEEKPLDPGDTEAAYAKNRRANFVPISQ